jgi:hypothetical protein
MATLTVRNLEPLVVGALKRRAKATGHSLEEEARIILRAASRWYADDFGVWLSKHKHDVRGKFSIDAALHEDNDR